MRRNFHSTAILFVFLFTQFVSMYSGLQFIASPCDFDNIDDISLEDVVALDPFLAGSTFSVSQTLPISQTPFLPELAFIRSWHIVLERATPVKTAFFERNQTVALRHDKGLWLANRVLII